MVLEVAARAALLTAALAATHAAAWGRVEQLTGGTGFLCARVVGEGVRCWGDNAEGQLGLGSRAPQAGAVRPALPEPVTELVGSANATCAVARGELHCFGATAKSPRLVKTPVPVARLTALHGKFAGIGANGEVYRWDSRWAPEAVAALKGATQVGYLGPRLCGLLAGELWCPDAQAPAKYGRVQRLPRATRFVGEINFACAISDTEAACARFSPVDAWNAKGTVTPVPWLVGARDAGYYHVRVCALRSDGAIECANPYGDDLLRPVVWARADAADPWVGLGGAIGNACGIRKSGALWCTGSNAHGELLTGTSTLVAEPRAVREVPPVVRLGAGPRDVCAVATQGSVVCWGATYTPWDADVPTLSPAVTVVPKPATEPRAVVDLAVGGFAAGTEVSTACLVRRDGTAACWTHADHTTLGPFDVPGLTDAVAVAGSSHVCFLTRAGTVSCLGDNRTGQLGTGTLDGSGAPVAVRGAKGVKALGVTWGRTVVAGSTGTACVGTLTTSYDSGEPERDTLRTRLLSVDTEAADLVAAGSDVICAAKGGRDLRCVTFDEDFVPDDDESVVAPVRMARTVSGLVSIAATTASVCLVTDDGHVQCGRVIGHADADGPGDAQRQPGLRTRAVGNIANATRVVGVAGDAPYFCIERKDRTAACWGEVGGDIVHEAHVPHAVKPLLLRL